MFLKVKILHVIIFVFTAFSLYSQKKVSVVLDKSNGLAHPFGVDFDSKNNMYAIELYGGHVYKMTPDGKAEVIGGNGKKGYSGDGGPVKNAVFNGMHNIITGADDSVYISDSWNFRIRRIDTKTGTVSTVAGTGKKGFSGDGGPALEADFSFIMNIFFNPQKDKIYMSDINNLRVRMLDLKSGIVTTVAGNGKKGRAQDGELAVKSPLQDPRAVAVDSRGTLYILERNGNMLLKVDADGKIRRVAGSGKKGFKDGKALEAQFSGPKFICVDKYDNVYIADDFNHAIRKYDPVKNSVSTVLGRGVGDPGITLQRPHGVTFHKDGTLYITDSYNHRILKMSVD